MIRVVRIYYFPTAITSIRIVDVRSTLTEIKYIGFSRELRNFLSFCTMSNNDDKSSLANWMGGLSPRIRNEVPLINLAIPGSHNSMTYCINRKSKLAPDASRNIRKIYKFLPFFVRRWARTQQYTVIDQLNNGIRYLDLRLVKDENNTEYPYYYAHGLYAMSLCEPLKDINKYLEAHPKELIILDFQHFYEITDEDHDVITKEIREIFGDKFYSPRISPIHEITLDQAYQRNKQIIVIYRSKNCYPEFFPGLALSTPWPNLHNCKKIECFLDANLRIRNPFAGYVSQYIYTPDCGYITLRPFSSLQKTAHNINSKMVEWIRQQSPGPVEQGAHANIFLADFVDYESSEFSRAVIQLNEKLNNMQFTRLRI